MSLTNLREGGSSVKSRQKGREGSHSGSFSSRAPDTYGPSLATLAAYWAPMRAAIWAVEEKRQLESCRDCRCPGREGWERSATRHAHLYSADCTGSRTVPVVPGGAAGGVVWSLLRGAFDSLSAPVTPVLHRLADARPHRRTNA